MALEEIDEATAKIVAEATERLGLRRYLWLYFFVVPLAAFSASTVAGVIAALQGLESHPKAAQLYAFTVIVGLKVAHRARGAQVSGAPQIGTPGLPFAEVAVAAGGVSYPSLADCRCRRSHSRHCRPPAFR